MLKGSKLKAAMAEKARMWFWEGTGRPSQGYGERCSSPSKCCIVPRSPNDYRHSLWSLL